MTWHSSTDLAAKKTYPMSLDNVTIQLARQFVHIVYMFTLHVSMLQLFVVCVSKSKGSFFKALPHLIGIHFL